MFKERTEAAKELGKELSRYKDGDCLILALPKGGLPIGSILSKELQKPYEVYLTGKIKHPDNAMIIGYVDLTGRLINKEIEQATEAYLEHEIGKVRNELQGKFVEYMGTKESTPVNGKTIILVNDGVEDGEEMISTVELLKKNKPEKIVLAVPVATDSFKNKVTNFVDEFVCLETQPDVVGVKMIKEQYEELEMEKFIPVNRDEQQRRN